MNVVPRIRLATSFFWFIISLILKEIQNQTAKETTNVLDQTLVFFVVFAQRIYKLKGETRL